MLCGFILALTLLIVGASCYALWRIKQGREMLAGIQQVHNDLTDTVSKIDQKATEALLRLDHLKGQR